ncbi:MAG: hypothetical protein WBG71_14915 [Leeuwenhoekiella sp.]
MNSITIEILNNGVLKILENLESLNLIRLKRTTESQNQKSNWQDYAGSMKKQSMDQVDAQLDELRAGWE